MGHSCSRISTGVAGLDDVLNGGLIPSRAYLVRGGPGAGKTILGLHFLTAGAANGESCLFISLSEAEEHIRRMAAGLGLDLGQTAFLDLTPGPEFFTEALSYDIFVPADVEREPMTRKIVDQIAHTVPKRVFVDSITQFRYLAPDAFQFRRQVLALMKHLTDAGATVLLSSEAAESAPDDDLQFAADGVITLEQQPEGRFVRVSKFRGSAFRQGEHAMRLGDSGMEVFPILIPGEYKREFAIETIPSGLPELDQLLHGGVERGTVTMITGPSGAGKTTLGLQFMKEAAGRGERSVVYIFEETPDVLLARCEGVSMPVRHMVERGTLSVVRVEPLLYSADEFAALARKEVEERGARIVMIDSVAGYRLALRGRDLLSNLHALLKYLANMGITVFITNEVEAVTGDFRITEVGASHMADNIVFLRYLEMEGALCRAVGVLKKRLSDFERTLRELQITRYGVKVGAPLTGLRGILQGIPEWTRET